MPWKMETDAKRAELLATRLETRVIARQLWNEMKVFEGSAYDVRSLTGQDPISEGEQVRGRAHEERGPGGTDITLRRET